MQGIWNVTEISELLKELLVTGDFDLSFYIRQKKIQLHGSYPALSGIKQAIFPPPWPPIQSAKLFNVL